MAKKDSRQPVALISVFDKDGITEFAQALIDMGWKIISSGGTAKHLSDADVPVTDVAEITGREAILGHRVVTLDPAIHGGLLATDDMLDELQELGFPFIDLVCVDFYPLEDAVNKPDATSDSVIESTDIGGPTMIRSGAKGRRIVVIDPNDRSKVIEWLQAGQPDRSNMAQQLAAKAEGVIAQYCLTSARFQSNQKIDGSIGTLSALCKYGENGWQDFAGLFSGDTDDPLAIDQFVCKTDNPIGYINYCDVDRLLQTVTHIAAVMDVNFSDVPCIAVVVKHGNACGASIGKTPEEALKNMISGDPIAVFGGVVMTNFPITEKGLEILRDYKQEDSSKRFLSGIVAPDIYGGANDDLSKSSCFLLENPALTSLAQDNLDTSPVLRPVRGGFLRQPNHTFILDFNSADFESSQELTDSQKHDISLAWAVGSTSTSNTITIVKDGALLGNGTGQQDRVKAAELAVERAQRSDHDINLAVAYSDSFFPFPDGPEVLINAGITTIFASSGSKGDDAVRKLCAQKDTTLCMMPDAVCRGFYGH